MDKQFRKILMGKRSVALITDSPSIYRKLDLTIDGVPSYEERCEYFKRTLRKMVDRGRIPSIRGLIPFAKKLSIEKDDFIKTLVETYLTFTWYYPKEKELEEIIKKGVEESW